MENKKRYVVQVDFYIYAENDKEAIEGANKFCKVQDAQLDNGCAILAVYRKDFGYSTLEKIL